MASQTHGIQQLLVAEKRAAEKVSDARKRKAHRIRQAREEAQADIEKYRNEREKVFKEFEAMRLGSREGIALRIDEDTEMHIEKMQQDVANNKEQVIQELISLACDIVPEVHRNYFVVNRRV
ncbi:V-type proton ATPase subunit G-like [Atheta coriaria]|uniref:V-type proton ATPase subunit G-like n=1 Tax=Dalotia coriaria TaxID=877792 RepID=UPI0031F3B283